MKQTLSLLFMMTLLLASCSSADAPTQVYSAADEPIQSPIATDSTSEAAASPATPAPTATPKPPLEKDAWMTMPVVPVSVSEAMRGVYQRGLEMGNDPSHFSIIGDCQNVSSYFLSTFDKPGDYSLGSEYAYLQPTIEYFQGSFSRVSLAVKGGFNAAAVLSPLRADPEACNPNESPLDCELRTWRPSIVFVSMETWWSDKPAEEYDKYMRKVLDRIIEFGAVPIIATKADNLEGDHAINATIAQIAYDYDIPLWNFWAAVQPLPDQGLSDDRFHLTFARNFFDDPKRMLNAWPWRNLTALQSLDAVHKALNSE
ncbi:MAG: SGNH/GDSL hydrolase family protein [Chloroflexota bacterium]